MTYDEFSEKVINMLPHKLREDNNALKLKKILKIIGKHIKIDRDSNIKYNLLLSIDDISGVNLDLFGDMFYVYRKEGESDDDFKLRILAYSRSKTISGSSVVDMQSMIDFYIGKGVISIVENPSNEPAKISLNGRVSPDKFRDAIMLLDNTVAAGVELTVSMRTYGTWQDLYDINPKWSDVASFRFTW